MQILHTTVELGLRQPLQFVHASDTHLTLCDGRDNARKQALAVRRKAIFPRGEENAAFAFSYAAAHDMPLVHTGDLIDFTSHANLECAAALGRSADLFLAAGNHEFSQYVGEAVEDAAYRAQSLPRVQAAFGNDIRFACRSLPGVELVVMDNGYYLLEQAQLDALQAVVRRGNPVLLFLHTPLYTPVLYERSLQWHGGGPVSLMAVPEAKMAHYSPERFAQQRADDVTCAAWEYIMNEPLIRALFVGHVHRDFEEDLPLGRKQYGVGCETLRHVTLL